MCCIIFNSFDCCDFPAYHNASHCSTASGPTVTVNSMPGANVTVNRIPCGKLTCALVCGYCGCCAASIIFGIIAMILLSVWVIRLESSDHALIVLLIDVPSLRIAKSPDKLCDLRCVIVC